MCKMKIPKQLIEKSSPPIKPHYYTIIVPKYIYRFVILTNFYFAYASLIIKVYNKVIDSLNRIYLNEYYIL